MTNMMEMILGNNPKDVAAAFLKAVEAGDEATIDALQAPECTWWILGRGIISRADYIAEVKSMLLTADTRAVHITGVIAEGDSVALEIRSEMTFGDHIYRNEYHDIFVVRDGLIVHGREYFDTAAVQAFQLSLSGQQA
jgi:ketosteroid isomerase-like protein